ncbi:MAG: hypothetical protein JXR70_02755 [Spirochaetales bacterium]|nr:hypothetical protein [Spirochaetales bacterium]
MKRKVLLSIILIIGIGFSFQVFAAPKLSLRVTGKWTLKIDDTKLTGLAGSDFPGFFESALAQVDVDVTKTQGDASAWTMYVSKADSNWDTDVLVYIKRTADGSGAGSIAGGTSYQLLTNSDVVFFTGTGDRTGIKIQFRLDFLVEDINVDDYVTGINYTVIE